MVASFENPIYSDSVTESSRPHASPSASEHGPTRPTRPPRPSRPRRPHRLHLGVTLRARRSNEVTRDVLHSDVRRGELRQPPQ